MLKSLSFQKFLKLIFSDLMNIRRDPMLIVASLAPWMILVLVLYGFPMLIDFAATNFYISLEPFYSFASLFMLILVPMLLGMVYGFILLDERDGGLIAYLSVTPLGKSGYLFVRMFIPSIFTFFFSIFFMYATGLDSVFQGFQILLLAGILALEAPMMLLFLGAFAGNKVEGIALSKGFGIILLSIVIDYFFQGNWRFMLSISPLWWLERCLIFPGQFVMYAAGGFMVHAFYVFLLFRRFNRRAK